jgi:2-polyprenyl-6-methoxyphenol hydroxylase-like FAD-dependent oxidoreductase
MDNQNILISGAGIAGLTLAYWLKKFGFHPTVVEISPKLREGGYAIDFWGAGYDVAERMGIIPDLEKADLNISELAYVDENNQRKGGLNYPKIKKLMNGRAFTFLRSDLSKVIYNHLDTDTEIIFGDSIQKMEQQTGKVMVTFRHGETRRFDLVAGADGLHSAVRNLAFGEEAQFEKYYGYYTASFTIEGNLNHDRAFLMYNVPGKQAALYSMGENKTATFFIFTSPDRLSYGHHAVDKQKRILRDEFENAGWKCPELLSKMDAAEDFYFDTVSQIKMKKWSEGRVTLVGDACDCPSLLSGQGSTLAMIGAYILAGELKNANGDYQSAFERYESIFKPFVADKQKTAQNFARSFVPKSRFGIWVRNFITSLMTLPIVSKLLINQFSDRNLNLKTY